MRDYALAHAVGDCFLGLISWFAVFHSVQQVFVVAAP